jgi:hypothetical protein
MSEWIAVSEKLPYASCAVLVIWTEYEKVAQVMVANIEADGEWWAIGPFDRGSLGKNKVSHWMPLPEPPKP